MSQHRTRLLVTWLLLATVYYLAARLSLSLAFEQANTSPVWPPTGIAIAAILYFGLRAWPGIIAGAFLVNLSTGLSLGVAIAIATGNALEAVTAGFLILRFADAFPFSSVAQVVKFVAVVMFATTISASIGITSLAFAGATGDAGFWSLWSTWWLGDAVGALVITPLLLTWAELPRPAWTVKRSMEMLGLILASFACAALLFSEWLFIGATHYPLAFIFLPLVIWTAIRFQRHGATLFVLALSVIAILGTLQGFGPFVRASANESLLLLQGFMGTVTITSLILVASIEERRRADARAQEAHQQLERRVQQRTEALREANLALEAEIGEREQSTQALRSLLAATGLSTDEEFFRSCTRDLAQIYSAKFAFVGVFADAERRSIRTLAVRAGDSFADNFVYDLQGTPCQDVLNLEIELVPRDAARRYPDDALLVQMGVDSYFGAPLISPSNSLMGLVAVMDTGPMSPQSWIKPVLGIFANRMALELERKTAEDALKLAAGVFKHSSEAIMITDRDTRILRVNPAFSRITGYSATEVIGKTPRLLKSGQHGEEFYRELWESLLRDDVWQGEVWDRRSDGGVFPAWQNITAVRDSSGEIVQYISVFSDITEKKLSEQRIFHLAHYDGLTGLPNRASFHDQFEHTLLHAQRHGEQIALLFLDLDHFKLINDASGHPAGDELLKQVAVRLKELIRKEDTVARLGGDEFTVLLSEIDSSDDAATVAEKILHEIARPFRLDHTEVVISASIGISAFPNDGSDAATLLKNADTAMYRAKENGRNNFQFYTVEMNTRALERLSLESAMRKALERDEFLLHYQPQVSVATGNVVGCEALVRWNHPEQGLISPGTFIPVAEDSGLIVPLGEWVMNTACRQQVQWLQQGLPPVRVAVNLSARQFMRHDLVKMVKRALDLTGIDPQFLELELTESMIMEHLKETIETLHALRNMGVQLSIDDFGTGYSSMAYLKRFPINKLKIDQSFVRDLATDPDDAAIVSATLAMGHNLNLTVNAEGVESQQQLAFLKAHGCDEIQGYYFCRPVPPEELGELLRSGRGLDSNSAA